MPLEPPAVAPPCSARTPGIAGVDEAGRGPLAGPLVVAAVVLDPARPIQGLGDSKQLSEKRREALFELIITRAAAYTIEIIEPAEIDQLNIYRATLEGMRRAVCALSTGPQLARFDGNVIPPGLPCPAEAWIKGDARDPAIGAASILAKVSRDRMLIALDKQFPGYGFAAHKGYPVKLHFDALNRLGPCPAHRRSFRPVRESLAVPMQADLLG